MPTATEVEPWVETIIRLWDDAAFSRMSKAKKADGKTEPTYDNLTVNDVPKRFAGLTREGQIEGLRHEETYYRLGLKRTRAILKAFGEEPILTR